MHVLLIIIGVFVGGFLGIALYSATRKSRGGTLFVYKEEDKYSVGIAFDEDFDFATIHTGDIVTLKVAKTKL